VVHIRRVPKGEAHVLYKTLVSNRFQGRSLRKTHVSPPRYIE